MVTSGEHLEGKDDEQEPIRASLTKVVKRNPNIKISAKVPSTHDSILKLDCRALAGVVREVVAPSRGQRTRHEPSSTSGARFTRQSKADIEPS
ncbi:MULTISPECIES: hypothetical protein [unclassified Nonomuraea]|uniref:hypothetical protein n=1 Tax=unclassified Nonomuraea TaxID=2593643 RepID=UPI0034031F00